MGKIQSPSNSVGYISRNDARILKTPEVTVMTKIIPTVRTERIGCEGRRSLYKAKHAVPAVLN
jgi:hypothetical protein